MRRIAFGLALVLALSAGGAAEAKKKPKKPAAGEVKKNDADQPPAPGDKGVNEGASGRKNATEDAARSAESPTNDRRP